MNAEYAELHCLSNFSFQRGASSARELFERAKRQGYDALAITDECSLAGIVRAWQASKDTGLPLIIGSEVQIEGGPKLVLLVENLTGYQALCQLITRARRRAEKGRYQALREDLSERSLEDCWRSGCPVTPAPTPKVDGCSSVFASGCGSASNCTGAGRRAAAAAIPDPGFTPGHTRRGLWRRAHACPRSPGIAGLHDRHPPPSAGRRGRMPPLSQWRTPPAVARGVGPALIRPHCSAKPFASVSAVISSSTS